MNAVPSGDTCPAGVPAHRSVTDPSITEDDLAARATQPPHLLTIDAAAAQLSMSTRYVRRLIAERRIVFYRLGRSVRIDPADLAAHINGGRVEPITPNIVRRNLRRAA